MYKDGKVIKSPIMSHTLDQQTKQPDKHKQAITLTNGKDIADTPIVYISGQ